MKDQCEFMFGRFRCELLKGHEGEHQAMLPSAPGPDLWHHPLTNEMVTRDKLPSADELMAAAVPESAIEPEPQEGIYPRPKSEVGYWPEVSTNSATYPAASSAIEGAPQDAAYSTEAECVICEQGIVRDPHDPLYGPSRWRHVTSYAGDMHSARPSVAPGEAQREPERCHSCGGSGKADNCDDCDECLGTGQHMRPAVPSEAQREPHSIHCIHCPHVLQYHLSGVLEGTKRGCTQCDCPGFESRPAAVPSEVAPSREQRLEDALYLEECALAVLEGHVDRGVDPIRDSYISGCHAILKSLRAALAGTPKPESKHAD